MASRLVVGVPKPINLTHTVVLMKITPIKTDKIRPGQQTLNKFLRKALPNRFPKDAVLAVSSKVIAIIEGRVVEAGSTTKDRLIIQEADYFLPAEHNDFGIWLTIKNNTLIASAGIDESNANGRFVLWPKDPQASANHVRGIIKKFYNVKNVGVVITDSKTTPLRRGTSGIALAHCGFSALNDYVGKPDIFGRKLKVTKANIMEGLAAAAVLAMGEGREQTPLALIEDVPFVKFQDRSPTPQELNELSIAPDEDLYAALLSSAPWQRGEPLNATNPDLSANS